MSRRDTHHQSVYRRVGVPKDICMATISRPVVRVLLGENRLSGGLRTEKHTTELKAELKLLVTFTAYLVADDIIIRDCVEGSTFENLLTSSDTPVWSTAQQQQPGPHDNNHDTTMPTKSLLHLNRHRGWSSSTAQSARPCVPSQRTDFIELIVEEAVEFLIGDSDDLVVSSDRQATGSAHTCSVNDAASNEGDRGSTLRIVERGRHLPLFVYNVSLAIRPVKMCLDQRLLDALNAFNTGIYSSTERLLAGQQSKEVRRRFSWETSIIGASVPSAAGNVKRSECPLGIRRKLGCMEFSLDDLVMSSSDDVHDEEDDVEGSVQSGDREIDVQQLSLERVPVQTDTSQRFHIVSDGLNSDTSHSTNISESKASGLRGVLGAHVYGGVHEMDRRNSNDTDDLVIFRKFNIRATSISLHYRPRKLHVPGLKAGSVTEMINFLALLCVVEGVEVRLASVQLSNARGMHDVWSRLLDNWKRAIDSAQVLGLSKGLVPLQSLHTILGGKDFQQFIEEIQNLGKASYAYFRHWRRLTVSSEQTATAAGNEHDMLPVAAATWRVLRALPKIAREAAIESLNLAEKATSSVHSVLYVTEDFLRPAGVQQYQATALRRPRLQVAQRNPRRDRSSRTRPHRSQTIAPSVRQKRLSLTDYSRSATEHSNRMTSTDVCSDKVRGNIGAEEIEEDWALVENAAPGFKQPSGILEAGDHCRVSIRRAVAMTKAATSHFCGLESPSDENETLEALQKVGRVLPIVLLRPLIGTTEAVTLCVQGLRNRLDPEFQKRWEEHQKKPRLLL
eukprot:Lankesteria_metandrocarpae@DN2263_c0_g1_i1.p2